MSTVQPGKVPFPPWALFQMKKLDWRSLFIFLFFLFFFWKKIYIEIVKVNAIIFEKNRTKQKFQSERVKSLSPPYPMGQPLTVFFPSQTFSPHRQACEYI